MTVIWHSGENRIKELRDWSKDPRKSIRITGYHV